MRRPLDSTDRRLLVLLALVVAAPVAGCSVLPQSTDSTATLPNATAAAEQYERLDTVQLTINATSERAENTSWSVQRLSMRPGTGDFRNVVRATGSDSATNRSLGVGSRIVSNGSVRYIYAARSDTVTRSPVSEPNGSRVADIRRLFAELRDDNNGTIRRPTPGISQLPTVPADAQSSTGAANESVEWRENRVTVQYRGTESVAGRSTYVVELRPATDNASLTEATLWLDTEYLYPLKRHTVTFQRGDRYEFTSVARNVTFDADLPDGTFEFAVDTLSENVSVVRSNSYDSRQEMVTALDRSVPDPTVPDEFAFDSGYYRRGDSSHLSLTYATADERESIRVSVFHEPGTLSGRQVTIDGQQATVSTFRGRRFLSFNDDGRQFSVSGTVENATLRDVAASLVDD